MLFKYLCKHFMLRRILPALFIVVLYSSCSKDTTAPKYDFAVPVTVPPCDTSALTWNHGIEGIIRQSYCSYSPATGNRRCHFPGEDNYDFTQYAMVADRSHPGRYTERMLLP